MDMEHRPRRIDITDVRELAETIGRERDAALAACDEGLEYRAAYYRSGARLREKILVDSARKCGLTLGPVRPEIAEARMNVKSLRGACTRPTPSHLDNGAYRCTCGRLLILTDWRWRHWGVP